MAWQEPARRGEPAAAGLTHLRGGGSLAVTNARVVTGAVMQSYASQMVDVMADYTPWAAAAVGLGVSADGKFGSDQCATVRGGADVE